MVTGNREIPLPPEPPRLPNTEKVVDYDRDQAYVHGRPSRDKYQLEVSSLCVLEKTLISNSLFEWQYFCFQEESLKVSISKSSYKNSGPL